MDINCLFTEKKIGKRTAPNRFVYQATETNNCDTEGRPTDETYRVYTARAQSKPGIIFIESIDPSFDCQARSNRMVITENNKESYRNFVSTLKEISPDTLIIFQISHAGRLSDPQFKKAMFPYSRSAEEKEMTTEQVKKAIQDFITASLIVDEIGGDGVDLKQAHGFLAGDFLHPGNNRSDEYGGSFSNRTRFFKEVFTGVKAACSEDFIIGTRISPYEGIPGGCGTTDCDSVIEDLTEIKSWARELEKMGIDFINVSAGYASANLEILMPTATFPEGVYRHFTWTKTIKDEINIPVIGSGYSHPANGNNSLSASNDEKRSLLYYAEQNIKNKATDFVGIGRQIIADPHFVDKLRNQQYDQINWCNTCSGCGILLGNNKIVGCAKYDRKFADLLASC